MRKFLTLLCVFCVVLSGLSYAVEPDDSDSVSVATDAPADSSNEVGDSEDSPAAEDVTPGSDIYLTTSVEPVTMGYSTYEVTDVQERTESTVSQAVVSIFGVYQPITHTVTDHLSDGSSVTYEQVVPGLAGVDWVWLSGVALFALMLWSLFRLLGVIVK